MINFPEAEVLSENTVRIPFRMADHLILIQGRINGKQGSLILDTGSKHLIINKVHFNEHPTLLSKGTGYSVNGRMDEIMAQRVQDFAFSTFKIPNTIADRIDLSHIEKSKKEKILGIIGHDVLYDFELYIDFYLNQITLFRTDRNGQRLDDHLFLDIPGAEIPFEVRGHSIIVKTSVNGTHLDMALDTGAEINFLDTGVSGEALKNFRSIKRIKLKGMGKKNTEMLAGKLYDLRLSAPYPVGVMRTILTDLDTMTEAYGTPVDGVLGFDFIAMKRLLINYKKKAITFVKFPHTAKRP